MIDVMVVGAAGRMGALTAETIAAADDLRVVARVDTHFTGAPDADAYVSVEEALAATSPRVAVDFTTPAAVAGTVKASLEGGVHAVVGTTGLTEGAAAELSELARRRGLALLLIPNFSLGAVLMMRFAAEAAKHFPRAEIVELHEEGKADAPSGTSLRTAMLMAEAGARPRDGAGSADEAPSRGLGHSGVRIHSVRLPGLVAHQEVVFGGHEETLTIRHDSLSRASFMPGVLLAVRNAPSLKGPVVGLESLLT